MSLDENFNDVLEQVVARVSSGEPILDVAADYSSYLDSRGIGVLGLAHYVTNRLLESDGSFI